MANNINPNKYVNINRVLKIFKDYWCTNLITYNFMFGFNM